MIRRIVSAFERQLSRWGYRIRWTPPSCIEKSDAELPFGLEFVIAHLMLSHPSIFFIQIGANDGRSNDPLYKFVIRFGWKGILLEPLPEVFEVLQKTYAGNPDLILLNAAISEEDGWRTLYTVRMDGVGFQKAHQFSSFRKESVLGQTNYVPDIAHRIEERQVRCVSFESLLREAGGRAVDILQIDAEGFDYTILKMIDFARLKPAAICYEHSHMSKIQRDELARLLLAQGYRLTQDNSDTTAYRPPETFGFRW